MSNPTQFSEFSLNHWLKVSAERRRLGMAPHPERGQLLPDHPLVGRKLYYKETGEIFNVDRVRKDWLQGWFLTAVISCNGSHGLVMVESLGCANPGILRQVDLYENEYLVCQ